MEDRCRKLKELIELKKKEEGPKKLTPEDLQKVE